MIEKCESEKCFAIVNGNTLKNINYLKHSLFWEWKVHLIHSYGNKNRIPYTYL